RAAAVNAVAHPSDGVPEHARGVGLRNGSLFELARDRMPEGMEAQAGTLQASPTSGKRKALADKTNVRLLANNNESAHVTRMDDEQPIPLADACKLYPRARLTVHAASRSGAGPA